MITVTFFQKADGYVGFELKGHAGYAKEGQDIVCSAVTALTFNTVNSIEEFTEDDFTVDQGDSGYLKCMLRDSISSSAVLLMKSFILGLEMIQDNYGNEYIKIIFKEV